MKLTLSRASDLLSGFADCDLLVVGDLMLDRYVSGTVERISPEAPVPILHAQHERSVPGGACNVALNIQALGGSSRISGITGSDAEGQRLLDHLNSVGVNTSAVVSTPDIQTVVKTRFVSDRHQLLRVDQEDPAAMEALPQDALLEALKEGMAAADGVILEDYGKGLLQQNIVSHLLTWSQEKSIPSGYDPKDNHELDVKGITFATPNRKETFQVANIADRTPGADPLEDTHLLRASNTLVDLWQPKHLLMTLGPQGMLLNNAGHQNLHLPTRAREVFDVSGAGDTVIATVLLALAAGGDFVEAAELANIAAGLVVAKLGTATTSPAEILQAFEETA